MVERKICLDRLVDIERFVELAEEHNCDIKVVYGQCIVNGRGLMGVVSLAIHQPLRVIAKGDDALDFACKLDNSFIK